jgi:hypothetical protein
MQRYKDKLNINSIVKVRPPTTDNLALLTTKELDDYIRLERNRERIRRKSRHARTFSDFTQSRNSQAQPENFASHHSKIFESSFLAKLNKMVGDQRKQNESSQ